MKQTVELLYCDWLAIKAWFRTNTVSKMIVSTAFFLLFAVIFLGIFAFSRAFFSSLRQYSDFGLLTANYIIKAAAIVVGWFAIATAAVSFAGMLWQANQQIEYLITQPTEEGVIPLWLYLKSIIVNLWLLLVLFAPILFAYGQVFFPSDSFLFFIKSFLLIIGLVVVTDSIAIILSWLFTSLMKDKIYTSSVISLIIFFAGMFALLNLIFPPQLKELYEAAPETFIVVYQRLPLAQLPINWQALIVFSLISLLISFIFQKRFFLPLFQSLHSRPFQKGQIYKKPSWLLFRYPLVYKDWLSIIRLPSEIGYGLFLLSIAVFFYLFLSRVYLVKDIPPIYHRQIVIFAFVWLSFFTTAFLLRLVFPLMAREGKARWFIFSLPIAKENILRSKIVSGLVSAIPLLILSLTIWFFIPLPVNFRLLITTFSLFLIIFLTIIEVALGVISPNYQQADDPEKVSTSSLGLLTLFVSGVLTIMASYLVNQALMEKMSFLVALLTMLLIGILSSILFFLIARFNLKANHLV